MRGQLWIRSLSAACAYALALVAAHFGSEHAAAATSARSHPAAPRANAVDAALLPVLADDGITPVRASDAVLCRRYALDLTGATLSSEEERAHCEGASPAAMVEWFMTCPAYVARNQERMRRVLLGAERPLASPYAADLDAHVARLYRGEIPYADFVAIAVTHPAFVEDGAGDDAVARAFAIFLAREPLPDERQDLLALYRMWRTRPARDEGDGAHSELYIDPTRCSGSLAIVECTSTATGVTVALEGTGPIAIDELTWDQWRTLRAPGRVIARMPGFWDAAIDDVLRKYPAFYDLPVARAALAGFFEAHGGDARALERELLTSALYTTGTQTQAPGKVGAR
jgi:hypothetical protein